MEDYRAYLPELKTSTLFQDIEDDALIALLNAMQPRIIHKKVGDEMGPWDTNYFKLF